MRIIRAEHLGMCFGVRDAITLAVQEASQKPVTVLGDLVHNETVLARLRDRGVRFAQAPGGVETGEVMITAHGASDAAINKLRGLGHQVVEATCPLVKVAHRAVKQLASAGYHPVIIGQRGHVEVRGLTEDLEQFDVLLTEAEVFELQEHPRFGVVAQTTQPISRVKHLVGLLRWRFPDSEVRFSDTVCHPTKQRQQAAVELASHSDVVVVIGGAHSNNTRELVRTCSRYCGRVVQVQTAADLKPEWLAGARTVGVTAGTSTPDSDIDAVEKRLHELASNQCAAADLSCEEHGLQEVTIRTL